MITTEGLDSIDQGTILEGVNHPSMPSLKIAIALNPTCLFHQGKADSIVLAYLIPAKYILERNEEFKQQTEALGETVIDGSEVVNKKKSDSIRKFIGKLIDNDEPRRHFYIQGVERIGLPDCFVDFQQVTSVPFDSVVANSSIIAKLSTPWREKLATHYAGYMMRIGVDRFVGETREKIIAGMVTPIKLSSTS